MEMLKEKRIALGLKQSEIARQADILIMSYQRYEYGERVPDARTERHGLQMHFRQRWNPCGDMHRKNKQATPVC